MQGTSSSKEKNIRLRHACTQKQLAEVNENLTREQKNQIDVTPFKWVLNMPAKLEISGGLLWELVTRWDEGSGGFRIRGRVVPFTAIDVCLAMGLPVVGERVPVDDDFNCYTSSLSRESKVTVDEILPRLALFEDDVGDFCRMYILLAFGEFYFPKSGKLLFTGCIKLLDDLESLNSFNWGLAIYDFLVDSLSKTARGVKEGKNLSQIHICGCAAILQFWALDHLSVGGTPNNPLRFPFPRFLNWQILHLTQKKIKEAFEKNLRVTLEVTATNEELQFQMVRDALHQDERQFVGITEYRQLVVELRQCRERIASLQAQVKVLTDSQLQRQSRVEPHNTDMGGSFHASPVCSSPDTNIFASVEGCSDVQRGELLRSTPQEYAGHGVDDPTAAVVGGLEEVNIEDGIGEHNVDGSVESTSNIITRMKQNPRKRVESVSVRTPFKATYARRRKGKGQ